MVVSGEIALRRWPVVNLAHACLAVMAGTALGGGGKKRIPVPSILIVFASMARPRLTLVQTATAATDSTASPRDGEA
jgi:hypothetical protein